MNRKVISLGLIDKIEQEINQGIEKWGTVDTEPGILLNAATEELGELAHAINKNEGYERVKNEAIETIGILIRLYWMMETQVPRRTEHSRAVVYLTDWIGRNGNVHYKVMGMDQMEPYSMELPWEKWQELRRMGEEDAESLDSSQEQGGHPVQAPGGSRG